MADDTAVDTIEDNKTEQVVAEKESGSVSTDSTKDQEAQRDAAGGSYRDIWKGWRLVSVQASLLVGLCLAVMDTSIVSTSLVTISEYFQDFSKATWIVLAYLLTYMGFAIIYTRVSDAIGRKNAVISAWVIFAAFSLGCALSKTLTQLIVFRALQGIGGSALYSMTMVVAPEITPPDKFGAISAAIGMTFAVSAVLGPIVGGAIVNDTSWRWIFYINLPVAGLIIPTILLIWPSKGSLMGKTSMARIDYFGALLLLAASALVVFGLQQAGATTYAWGSATIISTLVVGGVCWIGFSIWITWLSLSTSNLRKKAIFPLQPIFPISALQNRVVTACIALTTLTGFPYMVLIIQLPVRFQLVNSESPIAAGVRLLPLLCVSAVGSALGGTLSSKKNITFYTTTVGAALILLGTGLMSTLSTGPNLEGKQYGFQALVGLGMGLLFSSTTVMVALAAAVKDASVSQGAITQVRMLGGAVGLAISTVVFNTNAVDTLSGILSPKELSDLQRAPSTAMYLTDAQRASVRVTFAESFNDDMRICAYVAAAGFLASLCTFTRHPPSAASQKAAQEKFFADRKQAAADRLQQPES